MTRYLLLYTGPPPADPTHEGWPEWFESIGDEEGEQDAAADHEFHHG